MQKQKYLLLATSYIILSIVSLYILYYPSIIFLSIVQLGDGFISLMLLYVLFSIFFVFNIYLILAKKNDNSGHKNGEANMPTLKKSAGILIGLGIGGVVLWIANIFKDGLAAPIIYAEFFFFVPLLFFFLVMVSFLCIAIGKITKNYFVKIIVWGTSFLIVLQLVILCTVFITAKQKSSSIREAGVWLNMYVLSHDTYIFRHEQYLKNEENAKKQEVYEQQENDKMVAEKMVFVDLLTIKEGDPVSLVEEKTIGKTPNISAVPITAIQEKDMPAELKKHEEALRLLEKYGPQYDIEKENEWWGWRYGVSNIFIRAEKACSGKISVMQYFMSTYGTIDFFIINDKVVAVKPKAFGQYPTETEKDTVLQGCSEVIYKGELFSLTERSYSAFKYSVDNIKKSK